MDQGHTNTGRQVAWATKLKTVMPNTCESSVRNLFHVTLLGPRILRWLPGFFFFLIGGLVLCLTFVQYSNFYDENNR